MNFYKHHIGDYSAATSHLSWLEDMAYTRLLRAYYQNERHIPADFDKVCRLVRARSRHEREAVKAVLSEFFSLMSDGHHQKRCDDEISQYHALCNQNSLIAQRREATKRTTAEARTDHEPTTIQNPESRIQNQIPEEEKIKEVPAKPKPARGTPTTDGSFVWNAYSDAYQQRYQIQPLRNKKANSLCKLLAESLGPDAPAVASFYLTHNGGFYAARCHDLEPLLKDAQKLRMEWATGRTVLNGSKPSVPDLNRSAAQEAVRRFHAKG